MRRFWAICSRLMLPGFGCLACFSDAQISGVLADNDYFFSVSAPSGWQVERSKDPKSFWRSTVVSPGQEVSVACYAMKAHGKLDVDKLAELDLRTFENLAEVKSERRMHGFLFLTKGIEKTYITKKGNQAIGRFATDGTYGYMMLGLQRSADFSKALTVFDSFRSRVPYFQDLRNATEDKTGFDQVTSFVNCVSGFWLIVIPVGLGLLGLATQESSSGILWLLLISGALSGLLLANGMSMTICLVVFTAGIIAGLAGRLGFVLWMGD